MLFLILLLALYMGWNIGANDAANCVGADIGSGKMSLKEGIIITSAFSLLGALLLGSHVTRTIGKGIVPLDRLEPPLAIFIALAAIFGAALWITLATYKKLPVSTSHSIIGAVVGVGLIEGIRTVDKRMVRDILIAWLATPLIAGLFAFVILKIVLFFK